MMRPNTHETIGEQVVAAAGGEAKNMSPEQQCALKRELLSKKQRLWLNTNLSADEATKIARRVKHLTEMAELADCERDLNAKLKTQKADERKSHEQDQAKTDNGMRIYQRDVNADDKAGARDKKENEEHDAEVDRSVEEWRRYNDTHKMMHSYVNSLKINETEVARVDDNERARIAQLAKEDAERGEYVKKNVVPLWEQATMKWIENANNISSHYQGKLLQLKGELLEAEDKLDRIQVAVRVGDARLVEANKEAKRLAKLYNPRGIEAQKKKIENELAAEEVKLERALVGEALRQNNTAVRELRAKSIQRRLDLTNRLRWFGPDLVETQTKEIQAAKDNVVRITREVNVVREMLKDAADKVGDLRAKMQRLTDIANREKLKSKGKARNAEMKLLANRGYAKLLSSSSAMRGGIATRDNDAAPRTLPADDASTATTEPANDDRPLTVEDLRKKQYPVKPPLNEPETVAKTTPLKDRLCETFGRAGASEMLNEAEIVC